MDLELARGALIETGRKLSEWGLVVGTSGNLSVKSGPHVLVTGHRTRLDQLTPRDLVLIDQAGTILDGSTRPTSETPLHLAIYAATDATAIAHTHAAASTAVACVEQELPALHYLCLELGGPVPVAPYATFGSDDLARSVVDALGEDRSGALMANHGSIAFGEGDAPDALSQAGERLRILEWLCELHLAAHSLGQPQVLTAAQLADVARTSERMTAE